MKIKELYLFKMGFPALLRPRPVQPFNRWTAPAHAGKLKRSMRGFLKSSQTSPVRDPTRHKVSGQISIVAAALMGTTFFLFFAFVVNTGMLVHAKINLQNAADVAAYAGAASQARHLENIGILNYDLRRQYKRFLFRYYVIGNLYRPTRASGSTFQFGAIESGSGRFVDLGVPAVCLTFKANDKDRKSTRLNSSHVSESRMPSSA